MEGFIVRNYRGLVSFFIAVLLILAFLLGYEQGKRVEQGTVVLSCPDTVLSELRIPVKELASGRNTLESAPSSPEQLPTPMVAGTAVSAQPQGVYVGSKNGTKYYLPTCGTVNRIKPENYIWFKSAEDAKMQGYTEGSC